MIKINQKGETIVEVLISMALIAITITAAYVSGVNTMHQIQAAKEKQDAVSIARQQIELLGSYTDITNLVPCLSYSDQKVTSLTSNYCSGTDSKFNVGSVLAKVSISKVLNITNGYKISVSWVGSSGSSNVTMYYIRRT